VKEGRYENPARQTPIGEAGTPLLLRARLIGHCVARAAGLSECDSENAGQEVVARMLANGTPSEAWPKVRADAWARRIARNVVHEMLRDNRRRRSEAVDRDLLPGAEEEPIDDMDAHACGDPVPMATGAWDWIDAHLGLVTPKQAMALRALRECDSSREAARRLGLDHASLRERLARVVARMRAAWLDEEPDGARAARTEAVDGLPEPRILRRTPPPVT
jgi:DNA-directed RNA polymerase specialized sigma24 family protein